MCWNHRSGPGEDFYPFSDFPVLSAALLIEDGRRGPLFLVLHIALYTLVPISVKYCCTVPLLYTVCIYGHTYQYSKSIGSTGYGCQSCSWSAEQEKIIFPFPRSLLKVWSRETGSAALSRVSLLISILRLNLVLTYGILPEFRGGVHVFV